MTRIWGSCAPQIKENRSELSSQSELLCLSLWLSKCASTIYNSIWQVSFDTTKSMINEIVGWWLNLRTGIKMKKNVVRCKFRKQFISLHLRQPFWMGLNFNFFISYFSNFIFSSPEANSSILSSFIFPTLVSNLRRLDSPIYNLLLFKL